MKSNRALAVVMAVAGLLLANPVAAETMSAAEKVRRLDIMLMVTGLRCRTGADNFQADYGRFTTRHIGALNRAANDLKDELAARYGSAGSARALDRLSVTMANGYGQGHPWLDCHELKEVAEVLSSLESSESLAEAADQLLGAARPMRFAWADR